MPFRLIIACSKSFNDYELFCTKLDFLLQQRHPDVELVTGFSKTGDAVAGRYAIDRGYSCVEKCTGFKRLAGAIQYADAVVVFTDGGAGARQVIKEAGGKPCKVYEYKAGEPAGLRPPAIGNTEDSLKVSAPPRPKLPRNAVVIEGETLIAKTKTPKNKKTKSPVDPGWKERYKAAHDAWFAREYPAAFRDGHLLDPTYPNVGEANGMQTAVVNFLNWSGHRAKRINNMGRLVDGVDVTESGAKITAKKWLPSAAGKGQADVSATLWGRSCQLEIKAGNDKPSPHQLKEQAKERKAGGVYEFIHSIGQFFEWYDRFAATAALQQQNLFT